MISMFFYTSVYLYYSQGSVANRVTEPGYCFCCFLENLALAEHSSERLLWICGSARYVQAATAVVFLSFVVFLIIFWPTLFVTLNKLCARMTHTNTDENNRIHNRYWLLV